MSFRSGIATLGSLAMISLAGPALSGTSCPESMIGVSRTDVAFVMSTPTASVTWTEGTGDEIVPWSAAQSCPEGCYDLPNGTVVARGFNYLYGPGNTYVRASDDYVVVGPAGPALAFEVVLQLNATIEEEGTASVGIDVLDQSTGLQRTSTGTAETSLPVLVAPGTQFRIDTGAGAVGGHYSGIATAIAKVRFRGLPAGYAVTSCQGYDLPTPAQTITWGGVKALYR
jgi:hypothetical protein